MALGPTNLANRPTNNSPNPAQQCLAIIRLLCCRTTNSARHLPDNNLGGCCKPLRARRSVVQHLLREASHKNILHFSGAHGSTSTFSCAAQMKCCQEKKHLSLVFYFFSLSVGTPIYCAHHEEYQIYRSPTSESEVVQSLLYKIQLQDTCYILRIYF